VPAEICAVVERLLDREVGKVLVPEGDDLALGHVARELVLSGGGEAAELGAVDLGADCGREVNGLGDAVGEQIWIGRVGVLAVLGVLKWRQGRVFLCWIPCW